MNWLKKNNPVKGGKARGLFGNRVAVAPAGDETDAGGVGAVSGDATEGDDSSVESPVSQAWEDAETFRSIPVDPERLEKCHSAFFQWFLLEKPYDLSVAEHAGLRAQVPGYSATLERVVGLDLGVDEAFAELAVCVDAVLSNSAVARRWLTEEVWPAYWERWSHEAVQQSCGRLVTHAVHSTIAKKRVREATHAALAEVEALERAGASDPTAAAEAFRLRQRLIREVARNMATGKIRAVRLPGMAIRVQAYVRGVKARSRLARYKAWLARRRKWLLEQARAKQGLSMLRQARSEFLGEPTRAPQIERRQWGRSAEGYEKDMSGSSKLNGSGLKLAEEYSLFDYVDNAPRGQSYGLRTHKVTLPLDTDLNRLRAVEDPNAWVGVPVKVAEVPVHQFKVGPGPRTNDLRPTAKLVAAAAAKVSTQRLLADLDAQQSKEARQEQQTDGGEPNNPPPDAQGSGTVDNAAAAAKAAKKQGELERLAALATSSSGMPSSSSASQGSTRIETKYSWLPANLVRDAIVDVESSERRSSGANNNNNNTKSSSSSLSGLLLSSGALDESKGDEGGSDSSEVLHPELKGVPPRRENNPYLRR